MALLGRFFGRTVSEGAAYAFGVATGPVLAPATEEIRQEAWMHYATRSLEPGILAEGVAQGQVPHDWAQAEALRRGINAERFDRLVDIANVGPGMGAAFDLWRRGVILETRFRAALKRNGIEDEWIDDLVKTRDVLLSPAELANAVVQGHMDQDTAAAEAEKHGITRARFDVLVANTGLPPGPETGLAWLRRGILDEAEFAQLVREGHTKVRYIPKYLAALAPVLSHTAYAGLRLRGWLTKAESDAGGALTGYTPEQMELEFLNRGRPATAHQIHIGYARGGTVPGAANEVEAIREAVKRSDIRPEYEDVIVAGRYSLPSPFALRGLVAGGDLTAAEGESILVQAGWQPTLAAKVAASWADKTAAAATVNPRVKRARDQVVNAAHSSYLNEEIDRARAEATLERVGETAAVASVIVELWDVENDVLIKPLSAANVKKGYKAGDYTIDEATARLVNQQWSAADANTYLTT